jgi:hypothetical protein
MGIFSGIEGASYFSKGKNIPVGSHTLVGKKITVQVSQKNRAVSNFIMEFEVEASDSPELTVGDIVSVVYSSAKQTFLGNVKYAVANYMLACERSANPSITLKEVDKKIDEDYLNAITEGDGTAYAGFRIKCTGVETTIKTGPNAGQPFVRHDWFQIEDK